MENKETLIMLIVCIILPVVSAMAIATTYSQVQDQKEKINQLELETQTLEQRPQQTAGAAFPVPIPGYYMAIGTITSDKIALNAVNDTILSPNAITTNSTTNTSLAITSTTMINISTVGMLVLNRTSIVTTRYSVSASTVRDSYMRLVIDGVEQTPGVVFMANGTGVTNGTAVGYNWFNGSVLAGTHNYYVQGNVTAGGTLTLSNSTMIGIAYPK